VRAGHAVSGGGKVVIVHAVPRADSPVDAADPRELLRDATQLLRDQDVRVVSRAEPAAPVDALVDGARRRSLLDRGRRALGAISSRSRCAARSASDSLRAHPAMSSSCGDDDASRPAGGGEPP